MTLNNSQCCVPAVKHFRHVWHKLKYAYAKIYVVKVNFLWIIYSLTCSPLAAMTARLEDLENQLLSRKWHGNQGAWTGSHRRRSRSGWGGGQSLASSLKGEIRNTTNPWTNQWLVSQSVCTLVQVCLSWLSKHKPSHSFSYEMYRRAVIEKKQNKNNFF